MNEMKLFEPMSCVQQINLAMKIKQAVLDGDVNPLELDIRLKAVENVIESVRKDTEIKRLIDDEAVKYGKTFELCGAEVTQSSRKKYYYESDQIWKGLKSTEQVAAGKRKAREDFLKAVNNPETPDPETGELIGPLGYGETQVSTIKFK